MIYVLIPVTTHKLPETSLFLTIHFNIQAKLFEWIQENYRKILKIDEKNCNRLNSKILYLYEKYGSRTFQRYSIFQNLSILRWCSAFWIQPIAICFIDFQDFSIIFLNSFKHWRKKNVSLENRLFFWCLL